MRSGSPDVSASAISYGPTPRSSQSATAGASVAVSRSDRTSRASRWRREPRTAAARGSGPAPGSGPGVGAGPGSATGASSGRSSSGSASPPPCYLSTDGNGPVAALADEMEAMQLSTGDELLAHARAMLGDPTVPLGEFRFLSSRLAEALYDAIRVARSRE